MHIDWRQNASRNQNQQFRRGRSERAQFAGNDDEQDSSQTRMELICFIHRAGLMSRPSAGGRVIVRPSLGGRWMDARE